jgi:hypothetical protein
MRTVNAAGESGPQIYLAHGKMLPLNKLKSLHRLGARSGSKVVLTLNTYMADEAWAGVAPSIAQEICDMLVIIAVFGLLLF